MFHCTPTQAGVCDFGHGAKKELRVGFARRCAVQMPSHYVLKELIASEGGGLAEIDPAGEAGTVLVHFALPGSRTNQIFTYIWNLDNEDAETKLKELVRRLATQFKW